MIARTIFGSLATAALVLGGTTSPVSAHTGDHHHHNDEVKVLVCVRFDDHHHHHGDDRSDHGDEDHGDVGILVRTDEDRDFAKIPDGSCERFRLDFDDNWLKVKAFPEDDENDVRFKVFGDVEDAFSHDNRLKVEFDDHTDDPFVGVIVKVEDDHHHHDD